MPFRLRRDARSWFRDIEEHFTLDFDMYHLCLLAGIATARKAEVSSEDTTVLVDYFPGDYKATGRLIVALFVAIELDQLGVEDSDRSQLHAEISKLLDPTSSAYLSDSGMREINRYSFGGFDTITEWFDDRPHTFPGFLLTYSEQLKMEFEKG